MPKRNVEKKKTTTKANGVVVSREKTRVGNSAVGVDARGSKKVKTNPDGSSVKRTKQQNKSFDVLPNRAVHGTITTDKRSVLKTKPDGSSVEKKKTTTSTRESAHENPKVGIVKTKTKIGADKKYVEKTVTRPPSYSIFNTKKTIVTKRGKKK